ncbi:MAG TPA: ATP-binding cassette domain-containing protein [bacterium]|nr:ATP-binding cassette domain-containing protein [bacterium]
MTERAAGTVLALREVNTYRGQAHVLRNVSLAVHSGETVCLVGRNGAGKTTTMESVMGLLPVRAGAVTYHGREITATPPHVRARLGIGYAPDDSGIFPDLTVAEHLRIGSWLAGTSSRGNGHRRHADAIDELFPELRRLAPRKGLHLSGGEKKMVAIARSMALLPSLLLLDEAFEGLAPVVVNRFADTVRRIQDMGISMLIAESNVVSAAKVADRMYVIDRGEVIFTGTPSDVFANNAVMHTLRG